MKCKIWEFEDNSWNSFVFYHPNLSLAQTRLANVSSYVFWSISDQYLDLVCRLHVDVKLTGNFGPIEEIPWITNTDGAPCFVCKRDNETLRHFIFDCSDFQELVDSLWSNLHLTVTISNPVDGRHTQGFLMSLDQYHKAMLILG